MPSQHKESAFENPSQVLPPIMLASNFWSSGRAIMGNRDADSVSGELSTQASAGFTLVRFDPTWDLVF